MALPKVLSPGFWLDKVLRIFLNLVLAILLHVLHLIKVTGTLIELKPDELDENLIEKKEISMPFILNTINDIITNNQPDDKKEEYQSSIDEDDESVKEEYQSSIDEDDESVKEEEELFQNIHHNVSSFEMKTSHDYRSNITKKSNIIPFEFRWKHGGSRVFITGDFDNWSACKHEMSRIPKTNDFVAIIDIDCTKQHDFKFIVDGEWKFNWDLETRYDEHGNINNFIYAAPTSDSLSPEYNDNVGFLNSHFTAVY
ncbi:24518_t:CDS:2 [Entrophospora sp. SA101]|nr:6407_t:CDS:2 [Entrophospora sp. SA101]CAJ0644645.1 6858_t:CDS:2 [Entrophospora sp. SA101]CAJ0745399.1 24518_t:CDS:2 [Entrophospora sp. SA101]CAJ0827645.1 3698_t:CDS:2 [Entrophospora sp. SA101]CAJ0834420.1 16297_t:CDS:2 [Entrophospora sp. SA101]